MQTDALNADSLTLFQLGEGEEIKVAERQSEDSIEKFFDLPSVKPG